MNEEQQLIQDSAWKLPESSYDFESRKSRVAAQAQLFDGELWQQFAELGGCRYRVR
ncbi:MAG: hypothetical protein GKR94_01525 [Gammaproteobacteria bacterium]|nr:hypothetical protein [Gammaproteobacteria bacterium]